MDQGTSCLWLATVGLVSAVYVGPTFQHEDPATRSSSSEQGRIGVVAAQDIPRTITDVINLLNDQARPPDRQQAIPDRPVDLAPLDPTTLDLAGIRPGMSLKQAERVIAGMGGFRIERKDLLAQHVNGENIPELRIWAYKGANWPARSEKILVSLMGPPGQERVTKIERQVNFSRERRPTMNDVEGEIVRKFGRPSSTYASGSRSWGEYVFYPNGQRIPKSSRHGSHYDRCNTSAWLFGEATVPPQTPCGYYIDYRVGKESALNNNASRFSVTVVDQVRSRALSDRYLQALRANPNLKDQVDLGL